jgi:predicted PurR-regulated permease PerM
MTRPPQMSYVFTTVMTVASYLSILVMMVVVAKLNLATPLITALFSYFALEKLNFTRHKWLAVLLFTVLVSGIFYGFVYFLQQAVTAVPDIISTSLPRIIEYAKARHIDLPFQDLDLSQPGSLQALITDTVKTQLRYLGNFAKLATKEFVFLVIGFVVATTMFINPKMDLGRECHRHKDNLYSLCCDEIAARFRFFYRSFATVMGAQITISTINTALTSIFILSVSLPYAAVVIGVTFLCGLLPIIGNLISNAVIVGIAFTISPQMAIAALVFLVVLHKLEYFLNSKIIGDRIKNPVWLTLLGLILGERLMGIPGMILAPVVLNYIKVEAGSIEITKKEDAVAASERPVK